MTNLNQATAARFYPETPDGRYFVVRGRLWRCANPALAPETRQELVEDLTSAHRAISDAKQIHDADALSRARQMANTAKVRLGERGPVWWGDGAPDYNHHLANNTPYADWFSSLGPSPGQNRR